MAHNIAKSGHTGSNWQTEIAEQNMLDIYCLRMVVGMALPALKLLVQKQQAEKGLSLNFKIIEKHNCKVMWKAWKSNLAQIETNAFIRTYLPTRQAWRR